MKLNTEEKILLKMCRIYLRENDILEIRRLFLNEINWKYFLFLSTKHGISAICWHNFKSFSDIIPIEYYGIFESLFFRNLTRNTMIDKLYSEISILASNYQIKIASIKGLMLEKTIYGNAGIRQMSDLDILVESNKSLILRDLMQNNGFVSLPSMSPLHLRILPYLKNHLPPLQKNGISVDIHVKLFKQAGDGSLNEKLLDFLSDPSDHKDNQNVGRTIYFLFLVHHITRHENSGDLQIKSYIDLVEYLAKYKESIINSQLIKFAKEAGLEYQLIEKLEIIKTFWGENYIDELQTCANNYEFKDKFIQALRSTVQRDSISGVYKSPLNEIPGLLNKILFVTGYLFPSTEYIKYKYQSKNQLQLLSQYVNRWYALISYFYSNIVAWIKKYRSLI